MNLTQRRQDARVQRAIFARSISRPVNERLQRGEWVARVLATFEHACDLVASNGDVVALVIPRTGDGPLNIVVDGAAGLFAGVVPGTPVIREEDHLFVDGLTVHLKGAKVWEPRPDWEMLRARRAEMLFCLSLLRTLCVRHARSGSLLTLLGAPLRDDALNGTIASVARKAAKALREGWRGDLGRWQEGAAGLAGLGGGLTPAGDDFLVGIMLGAWMAHPDPEPLCRALADSAVPRTTMLSAAFLRAAAQGECGDAWHRLLAALSYGRQTEIELALQDVLAYGATSGADALAGFLYLITDCDR